jgi:hypothetical protein
MRRRGWTRAKRLASGASAYPLMRGSAREFRRAGIKSGPHPRLSGERRIARKGSGSGAVQLRLAGRDRVSNKVRILSSGNAGFIAGCGAWGLTAGKDRHPP